MQQLERSPANRKMIRTCMRRWRAHNLYGRSLGRGLSESELFERVALETGASRALIREALKSDG
ncbi:MAG: hypothetical protein PHF00_10945 [Elusimicrobia bacterium]|nr:hypothetical protein [Elusimicrobiota bacterium]